MDLETKLILLPNFLSALTDLDIDLGVKDSDEIHEFFHTMDVNDDNGLDLEEFRRAVKEPTRVERWASTLPLSQLLASCIPQQDGIDTLRVASFLSKEDIDKVCELFVEGMKNVLVRNCGKLRESFCSMDSKALSKTSGIASKFSVQTLACGRIDDFHKGLRERIGEKFPNCDNSHNPEERSFPFLQVLHIWTSCEP